MTIQENTLHLLPIKVFESTDVAFKDFGSERRVRNVRCAAAIRCDETAGFEIVCGLLDRIVEALE